jgi:hypothetical protein
MNYIGNFKKFSDSRKIIVAKLTNIVVFALT